MVRTAIRRSLALGLSFAAAVALLGPRRADALERTAELRREFAVSGPGQRVTIDNVFGSVKVVTGTAGRVAIEIRQWAKSRREAELALAFEEVTLRVDERAGELELEQDGPFRCHERRRGRGHWGNCDWDPDYDVTWDWTVTVPADVELDVSTVNDGSVVVDGVRGRVEASNVNGPVRARGLAAAAEISTVNGDVEAEFDLVPEGGGKFETVNGEIELVLPSGAGAELGFETMNGEIYSDFEVAAVPQRTRVEAEPPAVLGDEERGRGGSGGRRSYRLDRDAVVRIGAGGPRFDCETLNGDIVVRSR